MKMGKRKSEDKLEKYRNKIRRIEERRQRKKRHRSTTPPPPNFQISPSQDDFPDPEIYVSDEENKGVTTPLGYEESLPQEQVQSIAQTDNIPESGSLSTEVLDALGDVLPEQPKFGPMICEDVARILNTILKCGLKKEAKATLLEDLIPENCSLLIAPKMNMDIVNTVGEKIHNRDRKIENEQNQLGIGLSIMAKILAMLTTSETFDRLKLISQLCNAVRVLADLHAVQTKARKNLTLPILDKSFFNLVKDVPRDEFLFGNDLHQKIANMTASQRNAKAIGKKPSAIKQGNYSGPSSFHQTGSRAVMRPKKQPVRSFQHQNQQRFPRPSYPAAQTRPHAPFRK